jgi:hypothetical protein
MVVIKHVIYGTVGSIWGIKKKQNATKQRVPQTLPSTPANTQQSAMLGRVRGA